METNEPAAEKFVRTIDLGDGGGVQRFEADTMDELVEKLVEAQRNATSKIRDLNRKAKLERNLENGERAKPAQYAEVRPLDAGEKLRLSQEIFDPEKAPDAVRRMVEVALNAPVDEVRDAIRETRARKIADREAEEARMFIAANPEYKLCPQNAKAMEAYLAKHDLAKTQQNFQTAFDDLREDGLLELNGPEPETKPAVEEPRIVRRPRGETATAIRDTQASAPAVVKKGEYTAEQIARMTPEEYKQRILLPQLTSRQR